MVRPNKVGHQPCQARSHPVLGHRLHCPGSDLRNYKQSFKIKFWAFFHVIPKPIRIH